LWRFTRWLSGMKGVSWVNARVLHHIDRAVFRLSGERATFSSWITGFPVVMLTTTGAKSGVERTLPVVSWSDGDSLVVIASNYGRPRHPSWYHNLRANPHASVTVDGATREVEAREMTGEQRDAYYRQGIELNPAWRAYERWAAPRRIPVMRLDPAF
jgi:deazaflavin-dependent oxidoreductase (nitroreductase family)